mmetsp:Transcript_2143/g.3078  ORF Transcript_2143/g.3078 Transcript_2143/m.3078 type:complete len:137 (+) Transcript_2143:203-613(+)
MALAQGFKSHQLKLEPSYDSAMQISFVLSVSCGIAVAILLTMHIYLTLTGQTTIEFYKNRARNARANHCGERFVNIYDKGWRRNWQQIFGNGSPLLSLLPSRRKPPPPAIPFYSFDVPPQSAEREMLLSQSGRHIV